MPGTQLRMRTQRRLQWLDVTDAVSGALGAFPEDAAAVPVYCPHTTAGVTINEGWDPDVAEDVLRASSALVPVLSFRHAEGDSPAHLLAVLTGSSVVVPVEGGRLRLGPWQRVFLCEYDGCGYDGPRERTLWVQPLAGPAAPGRA